MVYKYNREKKERETNYSEGCYYFVLAKHEEADLKNLLYFVFEKCIIPVIQGEGEFSH